MYERLTYHYGENNEHADFITIKKDGYARYRASCEGALKLAAYEDSGLSPEEVQELAKAKTEGRLVVLPVKVGDRVYSIYGYLNKSIKEDTVKHICVQDGEIRLTMDNTCTKIWERSAFATREEAEKAIGGESIDKG